MAGVESEMELAFAGLQQLCAPVLFTKLDIGSRKEMDRAPAQATPS